MIVALAIAVLGVVLTSLTYRFAPISKHIVSWDVAFVSGISATALGSLGALVQVLTA